MKAAKANAALAPLADDPTVLAALTAGQRAKADALAKAAAQYAAVRAAWSVLTRTGQQTRNHHEGVFGELRDLPTVWPTYRQRGHDQLWPTAPIARLCWVATHATPWLPTVEEQEARWAEVFGAAHEQAKANRHALQGFASIGGGGL